VSQGAELPASNPVVFKIVTLRQVDTLNRRAEPAEEGHITTSAGV
jgi:hypothetical protein